MCRITLTLVVLAATIVALLVGGQPAGAAQSHSWARIYVEGHHTRGWHLAAAVKAWGLPSVRLGHCRTGYVCAKVYAKRYGNTGWAGLTSYGRNGIITVRLNNSVHGPNLANVKRQGSMHELGHVIGVEHDHGRPTGCMAPMDDGRHPFVSAPERRAALAVRAADIADGDA